MENPFKSGDKVVTHRKGAEIEAVVRTTWNHEVQVRAADGELLWRTMKTVRAADGDTIAQREAEAEQPVASSGSDEAGVPQPVEPLVVEAAIVPPQEPEAASRAEPESHEEEKDVSTIPETLKKPARKASSGKGRSSKKRA